jgi:hypothetical protein
MTGVCLETRYMLTDLITFFCETLTDVRDVFEGAFS